MASPDLPLTKTLIAACSVFVNRYRDSDPQIRAECIQGLGTWMKTNPDYWIQGDYLRYIGWTLSDEVRHSPVATSGSFLITD